MSLTWRATRAHAGRGTPLVQQVALPQCGSQHLHRHWVGDDTSFGERRLRSQALVVLRSVPSDGELQGLRELVDTVRREHTLFTADVLLRMSLARGARA